jgi:hypothetical protein
MEEFYCGPIFGNANSVKLASVLNHGLFVAVNHLSHDVIHEVVARAQVGGAVNGRLEFTRF